MREGEREGGKEGERGRDGEVYREGGRERGKESEKARDSPKMSIRCHIIVTLKKNRHKIASTVLSLGQLHTAYVNTS